MTIKLLLLSAAIGFGCATLVGCQTSPYYGDEAEFRHYVPPELH